MKRKCPICQQQKARRQCHLKENAGICSRCCAELRGTHCGDCQHYAPTLRFQAERWNANSLPDEHFIAEINPEVNQAVDKALSLAQNNRHDEAMTAMRQLVEHTSTWVLHTKSWVNWETWFALIERQWNLVTPPRNTTRKPGPCWIELPKCS